MILIDSHSLKAPYGSKIDSRSSVETGIFHQRFKKYYDDRASCRQLYVLQS